LHCLPSCIRKLVRFRARLVVVRDLNDITPGHPNNPRSRAARQRPQHASILYFRGCHSGVDSLLAPKRKLQRYGPGRPLPHRSGRTQRPSRIWVPSVLHFRNSDCPKLFDEALRMLDDMMCANIEAPLRISGLLYLKRPSRALEPTTCRGASETARKSCDD
jgi:hypothetical protein